jgi:hypothetical protein
MKTTGLHCCTELGYRVPVSSFRETVPYNIKAVSLKGTNGFITILFSLFGCGEGI